MRKIILFLIVFFIFDRFMNYKMNNDSKKNRVVAHNEKCNSAILLSEKKERTSDEHKKIFMAQSKHTSYLKRLLVDSFYSSNRNV